MNSLPSRYILRVYFLCLFCSSELSPVPEGTESKVSNEQTILMIETTLQTLSEKLTNFGNNVAALTVPTISFVTNELSFSVQDETQFETHLENCYNSNGFLLSDPQLLDNVPSELPHKLILSTFDTNLLLSKSLQKVVREIQKNRARCSIWTQETKEMSSSDNCAEENLKSICLKHTGLMTREVIHQHQVVQSIFPSLIQNLQNTIQGMSSHIVVQPEFVNQMGSQITAAGTEVLTLIELNATTVSPLRYSLLFHIYIVKDHLERASFLLTQSSLKSGKTTDSAAKTIVSDINALKAGFQTIAERQGQQQLNAMNISDFDRQLKGLQLKQQELEHALDQANLKRIETLFQKEDDSGSSGLAADDDFSNDEGDDCVGDAEVPLSNSSNLESLDRKLAQLGYIKNQNKTVQLWPTSFHMQIDVFYKYSIINFYAAVLWAILMVIIFAYTCLLAVKRHRKIASLESQILPLLPQEIMPKTQPLQPEAQPFLTQQRLASAIHKNSKS